MSQNQGERVLSANPIVVEAEVRVTDAAPSDLHENLTGREVTRVEGPGSHARGSADLGQFPALDLKDVLNGLQLSHLLFIRPVRLPFWVSLLEESGQPLGVVRMENQIS